MGNKDRAVKNLENIASVFADIINGFIFNGEDIVAPEELIDVIPRHIVKPDNDGSFKEQERDAIKSWNKTGITFALLGLENQTAIEKIMPLRIISYDGANYLDQVSNIHKIARKNTARKNDGLDPLPTPLVYPVVTLVLYFGITPWNSHKELRDCFEVDIDPRLEQFISNYKITVFEIAYLSDEDIDRFKGDFRIVAEFITQKRKLKDGLISEITLSEQIIENAEELLDLISAITGTPEYKNYLVDPSTGKEIRTMCEVMELMKREGEAKGYAKFQEKMALLVAKMNEAGEVVNIQTLTNPVEFEKYCKKYEIEG